MSVFRACPNEPGSRAAVVINRRVAKTAIGRDAAQAFEQFQDVPLLDAALGQRVIYAESAVRGLGVLEGRPAERGRPGNLPPHRTDYRGFEKDGCMSRKSVIITLPGRRANESPQTGSADSWVQGPAGKELAAAAGQHPRTAILDLREPRDAFEFAWMMWTFPMRAWFHWASQRMDQPRPR